MPLRDEWEFLEFTDSCRTPLHLAAENGEIDLLTPLLKAGADFEAQGVEKCPHLHVAAEEGRLDAVTALPQAGARLDVREFHGRTPLRLAELNDQIDVVIVVLPR